MRHVFDPPARAPGTRTTERAQALALERTVEIAVRQALTAARCRNAEVRKAGVGWANAVHHAARLAASGARSPERVDADRREKLAWVELQTCLLVAGCWNALDRSVEISRDELLAADILSPGLRVSAALERWRDATRAVHAAGSGTCRADYGVTLPAVP